MGGEVLKKRAKILCAIFTRLPLAPTPLRDAPVLPQPLLSTCLSYQAQVDVVLIASDYAGSLIALVDSVGEGDGFC